MKRKFLLFYLLLAFSNTYSQSVRVQNSPRPFTVVPPVSWVQAPTTTGNSRIKFVTPRGTPSAECAVIVKEFRGLEALPQSYFDQQMLQPIDSTEFAQGLTSRYNNVSVVSTGQASISGYPAQLVSVQFSVGTPAGELWSRGIMVTTATTPGLTWTIACGGLGFTREEAQKAYSYWQSAILAFHTFIKF